MRASWLIATALVLAGCSAPGDRRGAEAIMRYGCGSCHTIPGILGAHGEVGPSLAGFGRRLYAAGVLPNTPDNLARWIQEPSAIKLTLMPDLGLTPQESYDAANYLYSLK